MNTITRTLAALTLLAGCYNPSVPSGLYTCANPGDPCPDGLTCVAGMCRIPGDVPVPLPDMASGATDAAPATDLAPDCSMCKSGRCQPLPNGVVGCYANANAPLAQQCQNGYRVPPMLPMADAECGRSPGRWLGAVRQWNTQNTAVGVTPWWNSQPATGKTYRVIACCGLSCDSGMDPPLNDYNRAAFCNSGQSGDKPTDIMCPRGATPSDADWELAYSTTTTSGVMCAR